MRQLLLLVDDDPAVIDFLTVKLGREFDTVSADSAEQALRLARERKPDLILCDIDLHASLDGGDLSALLYGDHEMRAIPLIYLTGLVTPEELMARGNELAGRAAISKQASIEQIVARIRATLG